MTKKERIFTAIKRKEVDRIPTTYRGGKNISAALMKYLNIEDYKRPERNYKKVQEKLGADFWASGSKLGKFSIFIPEYTGPSPEAPYIKDGAMFYTIGINSKAGRIDTFDYDFEVYGYEPPLASCESAHDIKEGFLTSKLDLFDFTSMKNRYDDDYLSYEHLKTDGDSIICIGALTYLFMMCSYLRGMEQFLMDLYANRGLAERLIAEVGEFSLEFCRRELEAFGDKAEYYGTWDDVAGQNGILFDPDLFKRYFIPIYKRLIDQVKHWNLPFGWHCCGSVHEVLPSMIDAGIDVFDVVQTSAREMDLETIYAKYGGDVCIHGGIDVQALLVNGKPDDIKAEVKKVRDLWGTRGGVILAPSHEIVPDTPIDNVLAIYETHPL